MYTFSNKLKIGSIVLMALGLLGMGIGFVSAPSSVEEAQAMVAASHDDGHGGGHAAAASEHPGEHPAGEQPAADSEHPSEHPAGEHPAAADHDAHGAEAGHGADHGEHLLHQLQNRPWAAMYVGALFFFLIALGVLAFYAIQRAAQAGWSPLLFRVMEGITAYLVPGGIAIFVILVLSVLHWNHLFVWMDADTVAHDELLQGKAGYLNPTFFLIRAAIFLAGWIGYREISRKLSLAQDKADDITNFKKNFKWSAGFLVFYLVTESIMSWDWIMSVDPHWFSTLFGWYVFASMLVSGITMIALVSIYLKARGYLPSVNDSHIHDLAKFMFGISIFWTYLWFGQFMLIWYANIPEEVTYFVTRIEDFKFIFFTMVAMNFLFPLLVLMNSEYKRVNWFVVMTGIVVLVGHYLDFYLMIIPATVGDQWAIGLPEIGAILFFGGAFIFWVFRALTKAPLEASGNPYIEESRQFHY